MRGLIFALHLLPATAFANAIELYGFGAEGTAQGLSSAATPGVTATYGNPSFLTATDHGVISLGFQGGLSGLRIEGAKRPPLPARVGQHIVLGLNLPLGAFQGRRVHLGLALQSPQERFVSTRAHHPATPYWAFHDGYADRFVTVLALGWDLTPGFSLGFGAQNNVGLDGRVNLVLDPATQQWSERELDFDFYGTWTPLLGGRWQVGKTHVGFSYRSQTEQPYSVPASLDIEGLDARLVLGLAGRSHFTPGTTELAVRYQHRADQWLSLGLVHKGWSEQPDPGLNASLVLSGDDAEQLGLDEALRAPDPDQDATLSPAYSDTLSFAVAAAYPLVSPLSLLLSYGFEASPVPEQTGAFNQADGDNHQIGWRLAYDFTHGASDSGWSGAVAGRHRVYPTRTHQKQRVADETGDWSAGGLFHVLVFEFQRCF